MVETTVFGRYEPPADALESIVFAFDRDKTVDVNPPEDDRPAVPLSWVKHLAHATENAVFATGNQALKKEAEIPGTHESVEHHPEHDMETLRERSGEEYGHPLPRKDRVAILQEVYPEAERYIVVDDIDVSELEAEGWEYYRPWDFVEAVEAGELLPEIEFPNRDTA